MRMEEEEDNFDHDGDDDFAVGDDDIHDDDY